MTQGPLLPGKVTSMPLFASFFLFLEPLSVSGKNFLNSFFWASLRIADSPFLPEEAWDIAG
jgi:hypothetical protein